MNADLIKAGTITDVQGNSSINMTNGVAKMKDFSAIKSFKLLDESNNTKVQIVHNVGSGSNITMFNESGNDCGGLSCSSTGGSFQLKNGNNKTIAQAYNNGSYGGYFIIADNNGNTRVTLMISSSYGGYFALSNSSGTQTIYQNGSTGNITCVSLTQTSSRKTKENIKPIEDARKILDLQAVSFDFKDNELGTDKRGFIAEDVAEVLPNLVKPETETANAALDYIGMIPYLQAVIKEQDERIKALEDKITQLGG